MTSSTISSVFRSRDQDVGRDLEVEAEKFLAAGDILQRLFPRAPIDHRPERR